MNLKRVSVLLSVSSAMYVTLIGPRPAHAADADSRRWGVGIEATTRCVPRGHLGIAANSGKAITPLVVARYELLSFAAVVVCFGLPHPSMGVGFIESWEFFATI